MLRRVPHTRVLVTVATANLCSKIMDVGGFELSRILILRGGIPRPIGKFPESLSQAILVGIVLVGRLGLRRGGFLQRVREPGVRKLKISESQLLGKFPADLGIIYDYIYIYMYTYIHTYIYIYYYY